MTFNGVHKWHCREFKNLGWMVLAKYRGHTEKIKEYKQSLMRLAATIGGSGTPLNPPQAGLSMVF